MVWLQEPGTASGAEDVSKQRNDPISYTAAWLTENTVHEPAGQRESHSTATMEACVKLCTSKPWCTMVLHGIFRETCQLYGRKVKIEATPPQSSVLWNSAVNDQA